MKKRVVMLVLFVVLGIAIISSGQYFTGLVVEEPSRYQQLVSCIQSGKEMNACRLELGTSSPEEVQGQGQRQEQDNQPLPREATCRVDAQKTLAVCLEELGGRQAELVVSGEQVINNNLNLPSSVAVRLEEGAQFTVEAGFTLQIEGSFTAPPRQIFLGEGNVRFTSQEITIYPVWWNHRPENNYETNDAIMKKVMDALPNGGTVQLTQGTFQHKLIEVGNAATLQGAGCTFNHDPQCSNTCNSGCTDNPEEPNVPACCSTVIQLPDFPDNDEERFLFAPQENFMTCKTGIERCTIRNLEYDGNAQRNMNWKGKNSGKRFPDWSKADMTPINAHGIAGTSFRGRVTPRAMTVENLYIHDTIRNGIVIGGVQGGNAIPNFVVRNVRAKNSELDHLIYLSQTHPFNVENLVLEGYWVGPAIVTHGPELRNLFFKGITQTPLALRNPQTEFASKLLITARSSTSENLKAYHYQYESPITIQGLTANINNDITTSFFKAIESLDIENLKLTVGPQRQNPFYIFSIQLNPELTKEYKLLKARNIQATSSGAPIVLLNTQGELPVKNVDIQDVSITYSVRPAKTEPLISFRGPAQGAQISNIRIAGAAQTLITTKEETPITGVSISDVEMCATEPKPFAAYLGKGSELVLRNARIKSFKPNMILGIDPARHTLENVADCSAG